MPGAGVAGGDEGEGAAVAVGFGCELCGDMGGDALDILHERSGVAEDVVVDALEDSSGGLAGGLEGGGLIDGAGD